MTEDKWMGEWMSRKNIKTGFLKNQQTTQVYAALHINFEPPSNLLPAGWCRERK